MRSYEAARSLFSFLSFCAWAVIVLGGIVALVGMSAGLGLGRNSGGLQGILGAMPGMLMALAGLFSLAMVQMGRASVDTAEYAQQSLQLSREQLELSRQALELHKTRPVSFAGNVSAPAATTVPNQATENGPSYADQPAASAASDAGQTSKLAITHEDASAEPAIEQPKQVLLAPVRHEIIFDGGRCVVGGKQFSSRTAAEDHQELLYQADLAAAQK